MSKTTPFGRVFINLNEHHKPLKKIAESHNIPMGTLGRDLIAAGIKQIESGKYEVTTSTTNIQIHED